MAVLRDHADELVILRTRRKTSTFDCRFDHMKITLQCVVLELDMYMKNLIVVVIVLPSPAFR